MAYISTDPGWGTQTINGGNVGATGSGAEPTPPSTTTDPAAVKAWLQWQANQPNADPYLKTPEGLDYYTNAIVSSGGLGADTSYWKNKSTLASAGGAVGAGGAQGLGFGAGGFGSSTFQMPTGAALENYPGYQYAIQDAMRGLQSGAAAKGTLLNGRTQEAIGKSLAGYTAGVAFPQLFNQNLQTHQTQFGDLYNVANLGKPT